MRIFLGVLFAICAAVGLADVVMAQPLNAPAPLIGMGIPAAAGVIGALSLLRYMRKR